MATASGGFEVGGQQSCPLFGLDVSIKNVQEFFAVVERVSKFRLAEFRLKEEEEKKRKKKVH